MKASQKMKPSAKVPEKAVMMEDHDKAYDAWKERGVRARTLVHIDAHIDFGWVPEVDFDEIGPGSMNTDDAQIKKPLINPFIKSRKKMVHIGNYICPAIRDGMVERFYWVIPDDSWRSKRGIKHVVRQLKYLLKADNRDGGKLERHRDSISCRILGKEVIVCGLENLPRIDEPVLLDIDVDFMLTRFIWDDLNPARTPWIFPEALFEKVSPKVCDVDVLTIAYSVEGGFTPIKFKYLGDELRSIFEDGMPEEKMQAAAFKRKAFLCETENNPADAVSNYEEVLKVCRMDASAYFNLALLYLGVDPPDVERSARFYKEAVAMDASYATDYNNYGILYMQYGKLKKAEEMYRKFLSLDGGNASVLDGLGQIALSRREYPKAGEFFGRSLSIDARRISARLGAGIVNFRSGKMAEAEEIFSGLKNEIPDDPESYWWLGHIARRKGNIPLAISCYKSAVMYGGDGPFVHLVLFRLYMISGFYYRASEEFARFFNMIRIFYR